MVCVSNGSADAKLICPQEHRVNYGRDHYVNVFKDPVAISKVKESHEKASLLVLIQVSNQKPSCDSVRVNTLLLAFSLPSLSDNNLSLKL